MKRIPSVVVSIIVVAIIYGLINLVLVGGQKVWHHDDEAKLDELKVELKDLKASIGGYEDLLTEIDGELTGSKEEVDSYESDFPEGIPEEYYEDYTSAVNGYNEQLDTYNIEYDKYSSEIDSYNEKVEEANAVSEDIGSTWYVVPMPGGKH